jgi:hypothetical protein
VEHARPVSSPLGSVGRVDRREAPAMAIEQQARERLPQRRRPSRPW